MQHVMLRSRSPSLRPAAVAKKVSYKRNASTTTSEIPGTSIISSSEPTVPSEDGFRTLRTRKYGGKTLPIPEIMDPVYLQARDKYKQPKQVLIQHESGKEELETENMTPFQKKLYENAYARALGTPVRQCALTRARLPNHFVLRLGLSMPPEAGGKPYYKLLAFREPSAIGLPAHVQATREAVQLLAGSGSSRKSGGRWGVLASQKTKDDYALMMKRAGSGGVNPGKEFDWDSHMDEVVLKQLRDDVCRAVFRGAKGGYVKTSLEEGQESLAMIYFKARTDGRDLGELFSMVDEDLEEVTGRAVVEGQIEYDLSQLLDPEGLQQLKDKLDVHQDQVYVLKDTRRISLLTKLERLQNYLGN